MKTRLLSGIVLLAVLFGVLRFGGPVTAAFLAVISVIGLFEWRRAFKEKDIQPYFWLCAVWTLLFYALLYLFGSSLSFGAAVQAAVGEQAFLYGLVLLILVIAAAQVFGYPKRSPLDAITSVFGVLYIPVLFSFVFRLRAEQDGAFLVWLIFISAWGSDVFAYLGGRAFGKHKLAPELSPKKTREGAVCGLLGGILFSLLYVWIVARFTAYSLGFMLLYGGLIGLFGAALGQIGDLFASAVKRYIGIKDFGKLIPGHGGILDRFDSVLLVAPAAYLLLQSVKLFGLS